MSEVDLKKKLEESDKVDQVSRRNFLKIMGASFAGLAIPACDFRAPKETVLPYLHQPEEVVPGLAQWYASTCSACPAGCGILVKNREGRPIKIEGNPDHPLSRGGICARGQASLLDLYDSERLKTPFANGKASTWKELDSKIFETLNTIKKEGGAIRVVSSSISSPTTQHAINDFLAYYPTARHITQDALSYSSILDAHLQSHGKRVLPHYHFNEAKVIVSFNADFLGTWISPVEFTKDWSKNRKPVKEYEVMSWHAQFESRLSLSGANADLRVPVLPSEQLAVVLALGQLIEDRVLPIGKGRLPKPPLSPSVDMAMIQKTADILINARERSLVISGSDNVGEQLAINWINHLLDNYGKTIDVKRPSTQSTSNDSEMDHLIDELKAGKIQAVLLYNTNPVYHHPRGKELADALQKVSVSVSLSGKRDETASLVHFIAPDHHSLESWGDTQPTHGVHSITQPAVSPLYDTRSATESLLKWAGQETTAYAYQKKLWNKKPFKQQDKFKTGAAFWTHAVQTGALTLSANSRPSANFNESRVSKIKTPPAPTVEKTLELTVYASVAMADGRQANNPWLQELPDPITKVTWGHTASVSPATAKKLGVAEGRVLVLSNGPKTVQLPAHIQTGMPDNVVAVALGYGRTHAGKIAANYPMEKMFPIEKDLLNGENMYPFLHEKTVSVELTDRMNPLAKSQMYDSLDVPFTNQHRPFVQETTLQEHVKNGNAHKEEQAHGESMWPKHKYEGHKWAMAIDLNSCTGCSGCVVACQVENNIPVVGKAEVRKGRDMHWIRIDRYYTEPKNKPTKDSPGVAFQPMLCQHCDNAPCETVCPVAATVHSDEGLNMQVYNRCVGTRYCANNCPYKVRRFNWFDYSHNDPVQNLVLNPDITVRSRGIMEKCSFCVQRVMEGKAAAKDKGRKVNDQEIKPACVQSCPADALVFGDINDPKSKVTTMAKNPRNYTVLSELGVGPNVHYLTKVRNKKV